jgi:hypothetical protein
MYFLYTVKFEIGCPFLTISDLYRTDILAKGVLITQSRLLFHTV